jgi:hypothetical protein
VNTDDAAGKLIDTPSEDVYIAHEFSNDPFDFVHAEGRAEKCKSSPRESDRDEFDILSSVMVTGGRSCRR